MTNQIIVFGATGYTGGLVTEALVRRGVRPVLAGRGAERLAALAQQFGGLDYRVADVGDPASVRALVDKGDVLVTTVGPFEQFGHPVAQAAADAGDAAIRILVDEAIEQVRGVLHLSGVERGPEFGGLSLQHRHLRHHRDVGRRLAGAGGLLELDEPGFTGRLGDRFDGNTGCLGEFREDVLVERGFEIAAIDADLQRLVLRAQDRRHRQHGGTGKAGAEQRAALDGSGDHSRSPLFRR